MVKEIVKQRMIAAMKEKRPKEKEAYKYLLDALQKEEKSKQTANNPNPVLSEAEEISVIKRIVKQTKSGLEKTISEAEKKGLDMASLSDFVAEREFELNLYSEFLPEEMGENEIMSRIKAIAESMSGPVNKGTLMKAVMVELKNKANGKIISACVDSFLKTL